MSSIHALEQVTGRDVLRFIHHQLGQLLPAHGVLAGQSVTSVILYLLARRQTVHINDYDIFELADRQRPIINSYDDSVHLVRETLGLNRVKLDRLTAQDIDDLKREYFLEHDAACSFLNRSDLRVFTGLQHMAEGTPVPDHCRARHEARHSFLGVLANAPSLRAFLRSRQVIGNRQRHASYFLERRGTYEHYLIQSSRREGMLNHVGVRFPGKFVAGAPHLTPNDGYHIISQFDLNANQVGVHLASGRLLYTPAFAEFARSLQLRIVNLNRYWHSLVRYFNKKDEHGYYGLDECEVDKVMTYHALRNNLGLAGTLDDQLTQPHRLNPRFNDTTPHQSPLMGRKYTALLQASRAAEYLSMRKATVYEKYHLDLYEAIPRDVWDNDILNGTHKAQLERAQGERILGYRSLALATVIPSVESRYGLISAKRHHKLHAMVHQAADKGCLSHNDPAQRQTWSLATQLLTGATRLKGHLNQGDIETLFTFTNTHPEAIPLFRALSPNRWRDMHTLLTQVARQDQYVFHQLLRAAKDIHAETVLDTPMATLIETYSVVAMREGGNHLKDKSIKDFVLNGVAFEEITTFKRLFNEGVNQNHCVAMYDKDIEHHRCLIFSLLNTRNNKRSTAEVAPVRAPTSQQPATLEPLPVAEGYLYLRQHRGNSNSPPDAHNQQVLNDWLNAHNRRVKDRLSEARRAAMTSPLRGAAQPRRGYLSLTPPPDAADDTKGTCRFA